MSHNTLDPSARLATAPARRQRRVWKWIPYAGGALLVLLITAGLWPKPAPVETAHAVVGPLRATVNEEGKTRIRQRFTVSAPVAGQLRRIPFKAGAEMRAGETIVAVIDPVSPTPLDARTRASAQARRDEAAANVDKARAARVFAASELNRTTRLRADGAVSAQDLESAQWRDAAAVQELAAAEGVLRQAEAALAEFGLADDDPPAASRAPVEVRAPVNGRVLRVFEESSRVVAVGTPLVEVGDPDDLEVVIEVLSRDGAIIRPGSRVLLEQWGGDTPLEARVRLVEPAAFLKVSALGVEEQRVNVVADLITPPAARPGLGDRFRVEARVVTWETDRALKVPTGALFRHGADWATLVVVNGRARLRPVRVGHSSGAEAEVLGGLNDGDEVILFPGDRVRDGQRVQPVRIAVRGT